MEQKLLTDALILTKRMGTLLNETYDTSRQLAEAMDRNDQVSMEMLVAMRREPVEKLAKVDEELRDLVLSAPDGDTGAQLAGLLEGAPADPAALPQAQMLADQVAANARRLKQLRELDEALNRRLTREKSAYQ